MRGEKGTLYERGIPEPLIVRWRGEVKAGSRSDATVISVDFLPTFVELAGGRLPESQVFDGKSIAAELVGKGNDERRSLF